MLSKKKLRLLIISLVIILLIAAIIAFYVFIKVDTKRSSLSLIDQFYQIRLSNPQAAKQTLELILQQDPKNLTALQELGYWYLNHGDTYHALKLYEHAHALVPDDPVLALGLAKLKFMIGQYTESQSLLTSVMKSNDNGAKEEAGYLLNQITALTMPEVQEVAVPREPIIATASTENQNKAPASKEVKPQQKTTVSAVSTIPKEEQLMNQFYELNKKNPEKGWILLQSIADQYPKYLLAQKEAGYAALNRKKNILALKYFQRAYELTLDSEMAMQVGYILNNLGNNLLAFHYFHLATKTKDQKKLLDAELAMVGIAGSQTKILPSPFFADLYYTPFYFSRFKLLVYPLVMRTGAVLNKEHQWQVYIKYNRTIDNQSSFTNNIPSILEDDAAITSVGTQYNLFTKFPLTAFVEYGKAVDLVYRNRSRWRNDVRGGLTYYDQWNQPLTYTLKPTWLLKPGMNAYADTIYFTRVHDLIGSARIRPGFRVFEWANCMVDVYMQADGVLDVNRLFYNNIFEWGPGIAITPFNIYSLTFRAEMLKGYYLPREDTLLAPNPYHSPYHNNVLEMDFYIQL